MTEGQIKQLDVVQRRMLRLIVGWVRAPEEAWAGTMRRMRGRVDAAPRTQPVPSWSTHFAKRVYRKARSVATRPESWPHRIAKWCPRDTYHVHRRPGRPPVRFDDALNRFAGTKFGSTWLAAAQLVEWNAMEQGFKQHTLESVLPGAAESLS